MAGIGVPRPIRIRIGSSAPLPTDRHPVSIEGSVESIDGLPNGSAIDRIFTPMTTSSDRAKTSIAANGDRLTFGITVEVPSTCGLADYSGPIRSSDLQAQADSPHCLFETYASDGAHGNGHMDSQNHRSDRPCACHVIADQVGTVFPEHVCDGELTFTAVVDDEERILHLYDDLSDHFESVEVVNLTADRSEEHPVDIRSVDVTCLTGAQRRTLERAIERGYFHDPRGVDLETLADELDASREDLERRLRAAKGRVMAQLISEPTK